MSLPIRRSIKKKKKDKKTHIIKLPKSVFEKTLEVINDSQHITWLDRNCACSKPIHHSLDHDAKGMRSADLNSKISLARTCLLQRDIRNLAKTLSVTNPCGSRLDCLWYPLCVKYAVLCLAHSNPDMLNLYLQSLVSSSDIDGALEKWTQYPNRDKNM